MMRLIELATIFLWFSTCSSEITRQQCVNQGGEIVGDIGDGAIFDPNYVCAIDGLPPMDVVMAGPDEPIAIEGEVCCGGNSTNATAIPAFTRPEISYDECEQFGGYIVNDIGDGAIHRDDYLCDITGLPPIGTVIPGEGEPMAREGQVCCPVPEQGLVVRDEYTRQQCMESNGIIVGDIGDGAIFEDGYICDSNGMPPLANIIASEEPIAIEGEICCGEATNVTSTTDREQITRDECDSLGGVVVGDIGDGAIFADTFICESDGLPPLANIIQSEEPFAIEGEVCCGEAMNVTSPASRDELSREECESQGGTIVGDIGDGAIFQDGYICATDGLPPLANIIQSEESFAIEGEVCCGEAINVTAPSVQNEFSRDQCEAQGGTIVGDIGDGAIFLDTYICESDGLPPLGNIIQSEEPLAIEGEVCCGEATNVTVPLNRTEITWEECEDQGGEIVGDIGDGAIFNDSYICESDGMPPFANIVQNEEPFAIEGEVCCGGGTNMTTTANREEITREECDGEIVGDIGDGAIFEDGYICESTGEPPVANVIAGEGEPIASEGEVCCGQISDTTEEDLEDSATMISLLSVGGLLMSLLYIM